MTKEQLAEEYATHKCKAVDSYAWHDIKKVFEDGIDVAEPKWIKCSDRLPTIEEQKGNWKFIVSNNEDSWVDAAYFESGVWNNGECEIIPTHWMPLPKFPNND